MKDNQMKGYLAYWDDSKYPDFSDFLQLHPMPSDAEAHIGWHEAINEVMWEPQDIKMPKLVVCPKTGTIMPSYYIDSTI